MNFKSTSIKFFVMCLIIVKMLGNSPAQAQYCTPTFGYGCFSWSNHMVLLDSINWALDSYYCDLFDYTSLSTTIAAGTTHAMQVTNGNWCGCGVWIDLNQDFEFDSSENFFHIYLANETNVYNFTITIPSNVASGTYRMRVISGWGSDCFSESANGFGGCGNYQYGNFDDFTIHVTGIATGEESIAGNDLSFLEVSPNPATDVLTLTIKDFQPNAAHLQLCDMSGRVLQSRIVTNEEEVMDVSALASGVYFLRYEDGNREQTIKLIR